ncbi:hypothetical protein SLH46_09175 [Draconibacterium sp. IB214405]|uniref:hypothetical protein n=1 Tax=Draconibacterium sp. IB214405 TaxID=3097352 RepID=UPI002A15269A|nr:hypothetical protein [Draconibacterium sp. IB214405]MDX8339351.1 hypothetical protein [Draconibacterium sp. IB214405]
MSKKIINGIISLAIVIAALYGLSRLRFIERSIWIFKTNNEQNTRRGGFERGNRGGRDFRALSQDFAGRERLNFESLPDSVRQRIIAEGGTGIQNDSLRNRGARNFPGERDEFRGRGQGHDFRRSNSVRLASVGWFFIVFAGFTVVTIYMDMLIKWGKRRKK